MGVWATALWSMGRAQALPAFDVLPSGRALGYQQMRVGAQAADSTLANALSEGTQFGLTGTHPPRIGRHPASAALQVGLH